MLINNEFYYAFPSEFNDPFDSHLLFSYPKTREEIKLFLNDGLKSGDLTKEKVDNMQSFLESRNYHIDVINSLFSDIEDKAHRDEVMIKSFTADNSDILMWSHYSDCHKGLCLGFETIPDDRESKNQSFELEEEIIYDNEAQLKTKILPIWKVDYPIDDKMPSYNAMESVSKVIVIFLTKFKQWEYEQEYRSILFIRYVGTKLIKFNKNILKEVIFGLNTSDEDIKTIKSIVTGKYPNAVFKKVEHIVGKYKLEIKNLES